MEFYIIIPLHTYFSLGNDHVVHFIQDWTLGVLYVKLMARMMLMDNESHWARSLRDVVAQGYFNPDVKLATKKFILPASGIMLTALVVPMGMGFMAVKTLCMFDYSLNVHERGRLTFGNRYT
jgi:E3 ubiquitin-protein ligase MARCH6